jgi:fructose-1,6-bisphosphatase/inositol monophosphatase family enzyme/transcriptional regulator with XRE-family HTH domain
MPSSLSQKIVALRNARRMTQQDLADKLQLSRGLVAAWEAGRSSPHNDQLIVLANVFGVSYESLQPPGIVVPEQYKLEELIRDIIDKGETICESLSEDLWRGAFNPVIQEVMAITSREQRAYETYHWRHPLDQVAHERFLELIHDAILPFFPAGLVVFSEELINEQGVMEPIILPDGGLNGSTEIQEYVILDPLDRTAEAVRGIAGFANITVGSFAHGPLVSIVFSLFDQYVSCYYAITGQGARVKFHDGTAQPISPASTTNLEGACLAAYVGRPSRLADLTAYKHLFDRHKPESPFVNASGCYGFCLVASSQVDAFIEVAKGYAWHDIVSGAHILREAGGVVKSPDFSDLYDPLDSHFSNVSVISTKEHVAQVAQTWSVTKVNQEDVGSSDFRIHRYPFIAAATYDLGAQIAIELAKNTISAPFGSNGKSGT